MSQTAGEPAGLGPETSELLLAMSQEAYGHELAAEEDVQRSLPFFATALGLLVAAISYVASRPPNWSVVVRTCPAARTTVFAMHAMRCAWPEVAVGLLTLLAASLGAVVLWLLALATQRRGYERVAAEATLLARAQVLRQFYGDRGLTEQALDRATLMDLRPQIVADYAAVLALNRELTLRPRSWRARAMGVLLWSLLFILAATTPVVVASTSNFLGAGTQ